MNTFLPYKNFDRSARVLDDKRLGKQRVETLQILRVLRGQATGWAKHPAVLMWKGYEQALGMYGLAMCAEWVKRGFKDTCAGKIVQVSGYTPGTTAVAPTWLGVGAFHVGHQSNLVRKRRDHYEQFFPFVPDDLPYFWPTPSNWPKPSDGAYRRIHDAITSNGLVECDGNYIKTTVEAA